MLVLQRKKNEKICIFGRMITVTVVEIRHDKVRIGITCPKEITVHREEVEAKLEAKVAADRERGAA